ncbi:MAG: DUF1207 domain-containing protein [Desulfobacteraceae bacterium]|nr:DUF1207 domain-containing protein [Desulfobacteraceae bacterium]MCF8095913.1 DUF1207 domain-containing protein [Desulfobacteraceae bacterium]
MKFSILSKPKLTFRAICLAVLAILLTSVPVRAREAEDIVFFPEDHIFAPLVADPKEPRFFAGIHHFDNEASGTFTGAAVGYGETFGLVRKNLAHDRVWQLSIRGGIFSHFDMNTSSNNLLNSDYTIGLLWTYRYKDLFVRARAYHQSSHLGDEYAKENPTLLKTATGFDYEAVDFLGAWSWHRLRFYGGLHYIAQSNPAHFDKWGYQGGMEYYGTKEIVPKGVFVAGMDVKGFQELHWSPGYSLKAGLNFKNLGETGRYIQVMAEYYYGFIPFGQYYDYEMESYGIGFSFGF